jgi:hypothetical protein
VPSWARITPDPVCLADILTTDPARRASPASDAWGRGQPSTARSTHGMRFPLRVVAPQLSRIRRRGSSESLSYVALTHTLGSQQRDILAFGERQLPPETGVNSIDGIPPAWRSHPVLPAPTRRTRSLHRRSDAFGNPPPRMPALSLGASEAVPMTGSPHAPSTLPTTRMVVPCHTSMIKVLLPRARSIHRSSFRRCMPPSWDPAKSRTGRVTLR